MYLIFAIIVVYGIWLQYQVLRLSSAYDKMAFREYAHERRIGSLAIRMSRVERHLTYFPIPAHSEDEQEDVQEDTL